MEITQDIAFFVASFVSLWWLYAHPTKAQREYAARTSHADEEGWN